MLTAKQQNLLLYVTQCVSKNGVSPSFDEMKDALGLKSKSGIFRLIGSLEERGFIRKLPNRARALEILRNADGSPYSQSNHSINTLREDQAQFIHADNDIMAEIPLFGKIAAGTPIEAISSPDYNVQIPLAMLGSSYEHYALEVDGDSMIDAGIFDGDTVLIERCQTARDGDIIVALVDREEATLKTLVKKNKEIHLQPENKHFKTQIYSPDRVEVQGRLVGLLRKY